MRKVYKITHSYNKRPDYEEDIYIGFYLTDKEK